MNVIRYSSLKVALRRTILAAGGMLLLAMPVCVTATLIPVQTSSYFNVDGLLVDGMAPVDRPDGKVFEADIRQTPWVEPRRRIMKPQRPPSSLGVGVSPRGRALESMKAADVFAQSQDWKQALAAIQKGLDLEPDNILLIRRAAAYAAMARRFGVADEYFRKALQVAPDDVAFIAGRAGILLRLLRLNEAEELADRALVLSPGYLAARFTKTCVQIARGDDGEAGEENWQAISTGEASQLAEWLDADRADYIAALSAAGFEQLCERVLGPGTADHLAEIALALKRSQQAFRLLQWQEVIQLLSEARSLGVQSVGLELDIARSRFEMDEREEAEQLLRALAASNPDLMIVQYDHAVALIRMERFAEAQVILEAAHEKNPAAPQVIFGLACTYAAQGDMAHSWRVLNRLPERLRPQLREWTQGEEAYLKAIRSDPRFEAFVRPVVPSR
jgi:tetratricopeptide (TPR) repeat protein